MSVSADLEIALFLSPDPRHFAECSKTRSLKGKASVSAGFIVVIDKERKLQSCSAGVIAVKSQFPWSRAGIDERPRPLSSKSNFFPFLARTHELTLHDSPLENRYAHFAVGPWEIGFLSNSDYINWLDSFATSQPIQPHERLVDFVRQRLPSQSNRLSTSSSSSSLSNFASPHSHSQSFIQQPLSIRHAMNGSSSSAVDFSDIIDYSALGDEADSNNSYAAALDNSFPSTSNGGGGVSSAPLNNGMSSSYPAYSMPPVSNGASSSSLTGYPQQLQNGSFAGSSSLNYSTISAPFTTAPHQSQSPYYSSTPSIQPSQFFTPQTSNPPPSSTLAMQSQLIQDERNRRNVSGTISPAPFYNPPPVSQAPSATISPSMITNPQFYSNPTPPIQSQPQTQPQPQPVASTSRASSASAASPPPAKKSKSSTSTSSSSSSKPRSGSSTPSSSSSSASRWNKVLPDIQANLTASRLSKAPTSAAQRLLNLLSPFQHVAGPTSTLSDWSDGSDVPPEGRKEVLTELLKYGTDDFWKAWVAEGDNGKENAKSGGIELLSFWFEGASRGIETKKDKEKMKEKAEGEGEKKRREVEQMTLALVLQVSLSFRYLYRSLLSVPPPSLSTFVVSFECFSSNEFVRLRFKLFRSCSFFGRLRRDCSRVDERYVYATQASKENTGRNCEMG